MNADLRVRLEAEATWCVDYQPVDHGPYGNDGKLVCRKCEKSKRAHLIREAARRIEELERELETSLTDPAEQRAERYAQEAADLTRRLIAEEEALKKEQAARLTEVEHWVQRYNELEQWRIQTAQEAARLRTLLGGEGKV